MKFTSREYGIVGNVTALAHKQAARKSLTPLLFLALRALTTKNQVNQDKAISSGALSAVTTVLGSNSSGWSESEALQLLKGLMKGNAAAKDAAYSEGRLEVILQSQFPSFCRMDGNSKATGSIHPANYFYYCTRFGKIN